MQIDTRTTTGSEKVDKVLAAVIACVNEEEALIAFDRDGTLVPYANRPEDALLPPEINELMQKLAQCRGITAAIVSARSAAQLRGEFDYTKVILAGNYGMEISYPNGDFQTNSVAASCAPSLKSARNLLAPLVAPAINAILEDHGVSLCLHWHTVEPDQRQLVHEAIKKISERFDDLTVRPQPTSYEVLPKLEWSKAKALAAIDAGLSANSHRCFVFTGDSEPDEPAFAWVNERGGVSVKVGSAGGNTVSLFQLADTNETALFLTGLTAHFAERLSPSEIQNRPVRLP